MIELQVSLASNGTVRLPSCEQLLRLGYTKNRGVYRLVLSATGEWAGLAVRVFWHVPGGKDPPGSLIVDGAVDVPASVTAQPGNGCVTFEGTDGDKRITSADLRYRVTANSGTEDGTAPEPESDSWQQFVDAVKGPAKDAVQAATSAAASATTAVNAAESASQSASDAAKSASAAASSATAADTSARDASASAAEAARQAELAAQSAEGKGYLYLEDHDNSGTLSLVIADSITDEITLRDDGAGNLEVVYT